MDGSLFRQLPGLRHHYMRRPSRLLTHWAETPRDVQYANLLTPKARKLLRQLRPVQFQISLDNQRSTSSVPYHLQVELHLV